MEITFPNTPAEFRGWNLTVGFVARVDDRQVDCAISAEALEDHFAQRGTSWRRGVFVGVGGAL